MSTGQAKKTSTEAISPLPSVAEIVARLNTPAMEEIIATDDNFYNGRLRSNQALSWYNKMLLEEIPKLPQAASYHEIGGGNGLLPIALGMMGYHAVNIDHWEKRVTCGRNILRRMEESLPGIQDRVSMVQGSFPEAVDTIDCRDAFAITTNFAGTVTTEFMKETILRTFLTDVKQRYAGYIFDVCLLGGNWREGGGWQEILQLVTDVLGKEPQLFYTKRDEYARYYFVDFRA